MTETLPTIDPQRLEKDEANVERNFWRKLGAVAARIPFADEAVSAYYAARAPATPTRVRAVLLGALAYFVGGDQAFPLVQHRLESIGLHR